MRHHSGVTFYGTLWAAGSADLIATQFAVSFEGVILFLRAAAIELDLSAAELSGRATSGGRPPREPSRLG